MFLILYIYNFISIKQYDKSFEKYLNFVIMQIIYNIKDNNVKNDNYSFIFYY